MSDAEIKSAETEEEAEKADLKIYEVGFLLIPAIAEEKLPEEVSSLKTAVEDRGGMFISEDFPKLRPLAYTMAKKIDNKNQKYSQAYFGWFKFELEPSKISEIKSAFQNNNNIIRFILVETVRENTLYAHKLMVKKERQPRASRQIEESTATPVSQEEIDKGIDKLVASQS